jgi:hypothetical protein
VWLVGGKGKEREHKPNMQAYVRVPAALLRSEWCEYCDCVENIKTELFCCKCGRSNTQNYTINWIYRPEKDWEDVIFESKNGRENGRGYDYAIGANYINLVYRRFEAWSEINSLDLLLDAEKAKTKAKELYNLKDEDVSVWVGQMFTCSCSHCLGCPNLRLSGQRCDVSEFREETSLCTCAKNRPVDMFCNECGHTNRHIRVFDPKSGYEIFQRHDDYIHDDTHDDTLTMGVEVSVFPLSVSDLLSKINSLQTEFEAPIHCIVTTHYY